MLRLARLLIKKQTRADANAAPEDGKGFSLIKHKYFWIALFLTQVSFGSFYSFFTIFATDHGITLKQTSHLWIFSVICEIAMLYFLAPVVRRFSAMQLIKFATFATIIRWLLIGSFPQSLPMYYLSQSLHAFGFALFHAVVLSYLSQVYQQKKLANMFFYGVSYGLGGFVGSALGGIMYGNYLFYALALITSSALLFFYIEEPLRSWKIFWGHSFKSKQLPTPQ